MRRVYVCVCVCAVAEAVSEVKRQAMSELRKAVADAELKASQLIASERARLDAVVAEARKQAVDEILLSIRAPHESAEVRSTEPIAAYELNSSSRTRVWTDALEFVR